MSSRDGVKAAQQRQTLSCSSTMAQLLLGVVQHKGFVADDLPAAVGITPSELADVDARIPVAALLALWGVAANRIGDENFGLTVARAPMTGIISVINLAANCSRDLGECWRRVLRFQHLAIDGAGIRLEEEDDRVFLRFRPPNIGAPFPRYVAEFAMCSCLINGRRMTGAPLIPHSVRFNHPKSRDISVHEQLFGCPVFFDQPCSEVEFDKAILQLPIVCSDPAMAGLMERYAEAWLSRLDVRESFIEDVRRQIYSELPNGVPSAGVIAKRMHMSERSFSRRLQEEGASYSKLVDTVRKELAATYLNKRSLKLTEVAFLLGFSELSAFYRAHRRWTGMTPAQARTDRQ